MKRHVANGESLSASIEHVHQSNWVQQCRNDCDQLKRLKVLTSDECWTIEFAIRWAPFGGSGPGELMVNHGVTRDRFIELLQTALAPKPRDLCKIRAQKRRLSTALVKAWRLERHEGRNGPSGRQYTDVINPVTVWDD
ncbi:hypothetical protein R1CP_39720 (plasmid) [Rhodococcus opacus]|uniref:DUF3263 domain-containing protein n=1 Tax=Rhodococcus opacus TaxID=37919 RepID=A0A1B1KIV6_RHOOP|nr:hypothetical protein R1CP_39720 [Rhodococcus opacus]